MSKLVSQSEYARIKGCSKQYISKLIKSGKITLTKGKIDVEKVTNELKQIAEPARELIEVEKKNDPLNSIDTSGLNAFAKARTAREIYKAKLLKLEYEKKAKLYVDFSKTEKEIFEAARAARNLLNLIPDRVAGVFASTTEEDKIKKLLKQEIKIALDAFQNVNIS